MAASFAYVKDLHAIQLKNMASQYGVAPSENLEEMRHSIAYNMTEAQFVRAEDGRLLQKDAVDRMNSKFNDEYRQEMLDAAAHRQRVKSTPGVTINDGQPK
jgi:hypothetical protein